jgi:hypothetical protein
MAENNDWYDQYAKTRPAVELHAAGLQPDDDLAAAARDASKNRWRKPQQRGIGPMMAIWIVTIAIGVTVLVVVMMRSQDGIISQEAYDRIETGMTVARVEEVIGRRADVVREGTAGSTTSTSMEWKMGGEQRVQVHFVNQKVVGKGRRTESK